MVEMSKIKTDDFDEIFAKYLKEDDPRLNESDWKSLFSPVCNSVSDPEYGFKLTHNDQIVGILGMICSFRSINGKKVPFCNLHSWFVDEEHRGNSLLLMRPILKMKDYVVTDFTPTPAVVTISKRLGFKKITSVQRILPFATSKKAGRISDCQLHWDDDINLKHLTDHEAQLAVDHSSNRLARLLIQTGTDHCLIIIRRVEFHWKPYASILYASNPALLVITQFHWQNEIRSKLTVNQIAGDENHLFEQLIGSYKIPIPTNRLYRSAEYSSKVIDTLYSEVSLLGLTTLPGLKAIVKEFIPRR